MENIHVLPTDKPSSLVLETKNNNLFITTTKDFGTKIMKFQHIYITSDEEIKEGDWYIHKQINYLRVSNSTAIPMDAKKIILTTDQDLIKDGVQAIDNEFLEWFIKNPNYKKVEIETFFVPRKTIGYDFNYKIIIPKKKKKMKETLEKAAERYSANELSKLGFINGAKWQAERMYSEEELLSAFNAGYDLNTFEQLEIPNEEREYLSFKDWFEQFKNK
jgi:hypothetical protein